jgi:hypothetical protein
MKVAVQNGALTYYCGHFVNSGIPRGYMLESSEEQILMSSKYRECDLSLESSAS